MSNKELIRALKARSSRLMEQAAERIHELDEFSKCLHRRNTELENALRQILEAESKMHAIAREALE